MQAASARLAMIGAGLIWRRHVTLLAVWGSCKGAVVCLASEVRAHASLSRRARLSSLSPRVKVYQEAILCPPLYLTLTVQHNRVCLNSTTLTRTFSTQTTQNGRLKTRIWSHAHLTFSRASASPPASLKAPRRYTCPIQTPPYHFY